MAPIAPGFLAADTTASTAIIADLLSEQGPDLPIPTCPDWTLRQLATHVGRAHRWAAQIVRTRSAEFIPFRSVPDGRLPDDPAAGSGWLRAGAQQAIEAVQAGGQDQVWTFTGPRPASFWGRRMAHETAVHRADAELAAGRTPEFSPRLAADAVDEWLGFLAGPSGDQPPEAPNPLPEGKLLRVLATDSELDGASSWLISRTGPVISVQASEPADLSTAAGLSTPAGLSMSAAASSGGPAAAASPASPGQVPADVTVRGPAGRLLLVLTRRLPPSAAEILGDSSLLAQWLANTPF